jgi:hypothetical protein
MSTRKKRPRYANQLAKSIVDIATGATVSAPRVTLGFRAARAAPD